MARAAARSSPSNTMLEKGRGLIADGFFFIAHSIPKGAGGSKPRELSRENSGGVLICKLLFVSKQQG